MTQTIAEKSESQKTLFATTTVTTEISDYQIRGLLCGLFETSNPCWFNSILKSKLAPGLKHKDFQEGGKFQDPKNYFHPDEIIPTVEGCALILDVDDPKKEEGTSMKFTLNREALQKGLQVMALTQPSHWSDFLSENDDAITADVFGQCVVYGEVPYCV